MDLGKECQHVAFVFEAGESLSREQDRGFKLPDRFNVVPRQRQRQSAADARIHRNIRCVISSGDFVDTKAVKLGELLVPQQPGHLNSGMMRNEQDRRIGMAALGGDQSGDALPRNIEAASPHQQPRVQALSPPFHVEPELRLVRPLDARNLL